MTMKEIRLDGFTEALAESHNIVITNHTNPDGDAMGSALALAHVLKGMGKKVSVIVPNPYPKFLWHLQGNDQVMIYSNGKKLANEKIAEAHMLFHLDYNAYSRAADMEEALRAATGKKVMIDHHQQPEEWPDFMYSDTTMSSTCQMIYEFCEMYDWTGLLDKGSAECLYTGIVTDTGSFKYSATSSRTHEVAGRLLDLGVESQEVQNSIFDAQPVARLRLLGAMLDQLERNSSGSIILLYLSQAQCELLGYEKGITEGFVNYGLSIEGAQMTLFMREEDGIVKLSLRSKGTIDVNEIARESFNGGGHRNAAGGKLDMALPEALAYAKKVFSWD